jgi:peptidoglycan-N-acetylglucosamine deacetylase
LRAALAARGLRNGYVTADGSDWFLDDLVNKAKAAGKVVDMVQLKRLYIQMHVSGAEYADTLAREALGRSPAHVMLMHETDIAALFLPDMVAELRRQGWTVITADEAYRDRLSSAQPDVPVARGDLISAMAREKRVLQPVWPLLITNGLAEHMFNNRVVREAPSK